MKRILSSILVVLILLSTLSGCYKNADVLIIDDYPIYPGLYLYFQLQALSIVSQRFESEFEGKELLEQTIDDMSVTDWITKRTVELAQEFVFIEKSFDRLGLDYSSIEYEMAYYDSNLREEWRSMNYFYAKNGIGFETFRRAYENYLKSNQLFNALYIAEGGEEEVPEDVIKENFLENYTYFDFIRVYKVDDEGAPLTDSKIEKVTKDVREMKNVAEAAVRQQGELFVYPENIGLQAAFTYYCESNEMTEEEISSVKTKMFTEHTVIKSSSTLYEEELVTMIFKSKDDRFYIYEAEDAVYLFCRRSMLEFNEDSWLDYRTSIISELSGDTYLEYLEINSRNQSVVEKSSARRYFNIKKASL